MDFVRTGNVLIAYVGASENVVIPDGIEIISAMAFSALGNSIHVKTITMPDSVKVIEENAFRGCDKLKTITLSESLEYIGDCAFEYCSSLSSIEIPKNVKYIGVNAFDKCKKLKQVIYPDDVKINSQPVDTSTAKRKLYDKDGFLIIDGTLFDYKGNLPSVTVPNGVTKIDGAFKSKNIKTVILPDTLEIIAARAFEMCELEEIVIPNSVKTVGASAFYNCKALKKVKLSNSMTKIDKYTFAMCPNLSQVTIPKSVKYIAHGAFLSHYPANLEFESDDCIVNYNVFGDEIFADMCIVNNILIKCQKKEDDLVIPDGVKIICTAAFDHHNYKTITIPESVVKIEAAAFNFCLNLSEIYIPASVEYIGRHAFNHCFGLSKIDVSPDNKHFTSYNGVLFNKSQDEIIFAIPNMPSNEYRVPDTVKKIHSHAFSKCKNLDSIFVPKSVEYLGDNAFFSPLFKHIEIEIGAGSEYVGNNLFWFWDKYPLCHPRLPLNLIHENSYKNALAVGYCINPEKYEDEYAEFYKEYIVSHKNAVIKLARATNQRRVIDFCENMAKEQTNGKKEDKNKFKKMSPLQRVSALEDAILKNDIDEVKAVIVGCKALDKQPFEFTARALCLACEYCSLEIVKLLTDNGATFRFEYTPSLKSKYDCACNTTSSIYPAKYYLILAEKGQHRSNRILYGTMPKGDLPKNKTEKRCEILDYLLKNKIDCGLDTAELLYHAIEWNNKQAVDCLLRHSVEIGKVREAALTNNFSGWFYPLIQVNVEHCVYAITRFSECIKNSGKLLAMTNHAFKDSDSTFYQPEVLKLVFEKCDTSKINKTHLLKTAIDNDNVESISLLADMGCIKTPKLRDELIQRASDNGKYDALSWLLEYKNRTADIFAEALAEEKKMMRELNESPDSVSAMKRIWGYKKLEDGTLAITSYKGTETEVIVPEFIGKNAVSQILCEAFSPTPYASHIKNKETRENITSIVVPKSVSFIASQAFSGCKSLSSVIVQNPDALFGADAFHGCPKLIDRNGFIIINSTLIYFQSTTKSVFIPNRVTTIVEDAYNLFDSTVDMEELHIPKSVVKIGFGALGPAYSNKIYLPKHSPIAQTLKKDYPLAAIIEKA